MENTICELRRYEGAFLSRRTYQTIYNQLPIQVEGVESWECPRCGECLLTPEQAHDISERVKAAARQRLGLLPPEKVAAIRKRNKLTQEELERLLGVGKKVAAPWEKGRVLQNGSADVLLRLIDRNPAIIEELRQIRAAAFATEMGDNRQENGA